ncbi:tetratricopeptide repeat protein [Halobacillus litoralis]|uniref:tetratricopeptide repeat protein n=1 Tax=Halobacillus litoralis TaxID=45668 RepID=UPI00248FE998|nr:hypothetical protein [Halobacillus litoralis]
MKSIQLVSNKQKNPECVQPERVTFFKQGQVMEAINEHNEMYYLFFYKQQFLTAVKTKSLKRYSYIAQAFSEGAIYEAPHPFIEALVTENQPLQKLSYPQLIKKIDHNHTKQEQAHILTFFESFIPKKQLFKEIKSLFYQYRREGKMFAAYTIVRELRDFAPKNSFVKQVGNDLSFSKFHTMYEEESQKLKDRDPLFAEENASNHLKISILENENRWIEAVSIHMKEISVHPTNEGYQTFINVVNHHFDENSHTCLLEELSRSLPSFDRLSEDLFQKYMHTRQLHKLSKLVTDQGVELDNSQLQALSTTLETFDFTEHPESMNALMERIVAAHPENAEPLLEKYVKALMETLELEDISERLAGFPRHFSIIEKVDRMNGIRDDLDQMQQLGEWYYELEQLDKALECFQLEMEMKPSDPKPLRWLAQVYQDKKMVHESKAYQQLCIDVQKWA